MLSGGQTSGCLLGTYSLFVMSPCCSSVVIGPSLFTMLLVMALVTTVMTNPMLTWFAGRTPDLADDPASSRA